MKVNTLGELCNIVSGGTPSRSKAEYLVLHLGRKQSIGLKGQFLGLKLEISKGNM